MNMAGSWITFQPNFKAFDIKGGRMGTRFFDFTKPVKLTCALSIPTPWQGYRPHGTLNYYD